MRVIPAGHECRHVEGFTGQGSTAANKLFSLPATALTTVRSDSCQGGGLTTIELAEFGHLGQEAQDGFRADPDHLLQTFGLTLQPRRTLEQGIDLFLDFLKMRAQL